jgi:RNA polymerase sigma-70 factor (ECF subfamily)
MAAAGEEKGPDGVSSAEAKKLERGLVEATQNGDKEAFGKLIRMHQKRLFRFIYSLVRSFDKAEDIVQEAFVKAYTAIMTFNTEYAFYPWLSTIARNLAFNLIGRDEKASSLDRMTEEGYDPASTELGPMDQLLDGESQRRYAKAVGALPDKYRVVFVLRQFEQMDYAAIASYLKIPPGTVDSRLHRARQLLLEGLKDLL